MAAVVTSDPHRDYKFVQLGFPTNFASYYATHGAPLEYFGSPLRAAPPLPEGDSTQDQYHAQKRRDAHYMAQAAVKTIASSANHMESFHANYDLPKPVLGQRKYANPSYGSGYADIYTARKWSEATGEDSCDEDMDGGVRTAKGQAWAFRKLQQRADQIQEMKDNPGRFTSYEAPEFATLKEEALASQGVAEVAGPRLYLELAGLLNTVTSSIQTGDYGKIVLNDLFQMLKILFRVGATANREELGDLLAVVNENLEGIKGQTYLVRRPPHPRAPRDVVSKYNSFVGQMGFLGTIQILLQQTHEYITRMLGSVDKSPKERKAASRAVIRNLQFTRPVGRLDIGSTGRDIDEAVYGRRELTEAGIAKNVATIADLTNQIKETEDKLKERVALNKVTKTYRTTRAADRTPQLTNANTRAHARLVAIKREEDRLVDMLTGRRMNFRDLIKALKADISGIKMTGTRIIPSVEADALGRGHPVETGGSERIRSQLASKLTKVDEEPSREARLTKDPRSTWADRSGAYYGEALPGYPDAFIARNGRRAPKDAGLPTTAPVQATPVFSDKK